MTQEMPGSTAAMTCGFIGLGNQGAPIARRMIGAGFPTTLWARRAETLVPFVDTGAAIASDVTELAAACAHVGICVVDDAGVREVCDQLLPAMQPGSVIAIHSTVSAALCRTLAAEAAQRGVSLIDAPVSGGAPAANAGRLTVMVGGPSEAVAQARRVFESFSALVLHLGDVGAGQCGKLVNNTLLAANLNAAQNAVNAGTALGLDRAALAELLRASTGNSFALGVVVGLPGLATFAHGGALLHKDADLLAGSLPGNTAIAALREAALPFLEAVRDAARATS